MKSKKIIKKAKQQLIIEIVCDIIFALLIIFIWRIIMSEDADGDTSSNHRTKDFNNKDNIGMAA